MIKTDNTNNNTNNVFTSYEGEEKSFVIPGGTVSVGAGAFKDNKSIEKVTIPEGVTTIAAGAFKGCSKLEELTIPESMEEIEPGAFDDCANLSVINVPDNFTLVDVYDLYNTKWYRDRKKDDFVILGTVLLEYNGRDKEIIVPDGITAIVDKALVNAEPDRILCYPKNAKSAFPGAVSDIGEPMIAIYYN